MIHRIRNRECVPYIATEGIFEKPLRIDQYKEKYVPCDGGTVFDRVYNYNTLASARRYACFKPFIHLVPKDALDLVLTSTYDHSSQQFPEHVDIYFQPETLGKQTWRRLRNTRDLTPDREEQASSAKTGVGEDTKKNIKAKKRQRTIPFRYNSDHKLLIGGTTVKTHPSSIKLINSSHHSPQTNAGYSRQPSDGTFYQY